MDEGTNKRQICGLHSFGHHSVATAVIGKNGGQHFKNGIGSVNHYEHGYELHDCRDGEKKVFDTTKELYKYLEYKYAAEIEHFKYHTPNEVLPKLYEAWWLLRDDLRTPEGRTFQTEHQMKKLNETILALGGELP